MQILKTEIISEVAAGLVMSFPFPSSHTLNVKADELPISAGLKRKKDKKKRRKESEIYFTWQIAQSNIFTTGASFLSNYL